MIARLRTFVCQRVECGRTFEAFAGNTQRKYCDECLRIVTLTRKRINNAKSNAKRRGKLIAEEKPRLVRYAGYDPSEH